MQDTTYIINLKNHAMMTHHATLYVYYNDTIIYNPSATAFFVICEIIRCLILNFHDFQIYFIDILPVNDEMKNTEHHRRRPIRNAIKHSPACNKRGLILYKMGAGQYPPDKSPRLYCNAARPIQCECWLFTQMWKTLTRQHHLPKRNSS